jgi:UDPglucose 6-dehydrogenase
MRSEAMKLTPAADTRTPGSASRPPARAPLRIAVIGSGRVGLVTAAGLALAGHDVVAVDADEARIARLTDGQIDLHEAGLGDLVRAQLVARRLRFTHKTRPALRGADLVFVAVDTPARDDGSTDMRAVDALLDDLVAEVRAPSVVAIRSTMPVGSAHDMQARLDAACTADRHAPRVLANPEFLREGSAVADFLQPDRVIVGDDADADADEARQLLLAAYAPLLAADVPVLPMDTRSAELSKHAANAALAMRISFVNEIATIAVATGADIEKVCDGIGSDRRIGRAFLRAGLGYGGASLPTDVAALRETARRHNVRSDLLQATERVNDRQRCWAFNELQRDMGSRARLRGLRVALWGLSFKPGTDDVRGAPGLALIDRLVRAGVHLALYDPAAMANARAALTLDRHTRWAVSALQALEGADALILATEWDEFVDVDPAAVAAALRLRTVYDGRNALDATRWTEAGLRVVQVGRPTLPPPARSARLDPSADTRPGRTGRRPVRALDFAT